MLSLLIFTTVLSMSYGQQRVDTDPHRLDVQEGQTREFVCRVASPIKFCRIEIPSLGSGMNIFSENDQLPHGFTFVGSGFQSGECGLRFTVKKEYSGDIKCTLIGQTSSADLVGIIPVVLTVVPSAPEIELGRPFFEAGTQLNVSCSSRDGRPAATISWFLDEQEIFVDNRYIETFDDPRSNLTTIRSTLIRNIEADDDGKRLTCRAMHPGYPDQGNGPVSDTTSPLIVKFKPVPMTEQRFHGLVLGTTAKITVQFRSNPVPRVSWVIDGQNYNQGDQRDRFIVYEPRPVGGNMYNATLDIGGLTLEDTTKTYTLKAYNDFGPTEYRVRISSSSAIVDEGGLGILTIIGIIIGVLIIVTAIVIVVVARVTRKWCFAGDEFRTEGPDSEAQIHEEKDAKYEEYEQQQESEPPTQEEPPKAQNGKKAAKKEVNGNTSV